MDWDIHLAANIGQRGGRRGREGMATRKVSVALRQFFFLTFYIVAISLTMNMHFYITKKQNKAIFTEKKISTVLAEKSTVL